MLFELFDAWAVLNHSVPFSCLDTIPGVLHESYKAVCEFMNSLHLSALDGIGRNQVHPDPEGSSAGQNDPHAVC